MFEAIIAAIRVWVEKYGRLDIPASRPLREADIPASLKAVLTPLLDDLGQVTEENAPLLAEEVLRWSEIVRDELGVPHLYLALTGARDPAALVEGLTEDDLEVSWLMTAAIQGAQS